MSDPIDVLIIGFGAIGTLYGYILTQGGARVTAVARSNYDEVSAGIDISSEKFGQINNWKPYRVCRSTEEAAALGPYKYIVATFKCIPDLIPTSSILAPVLEHDNASVHKPCVVLIQNGIGIEAPVQQAYPDIPIVSVVAWVGANLYPGRITHGLLEKLVIGLYEGEGRNAETNPTSGETLDPLSDPAGYKLAGGEERKQHGIRRTEQFADLLRQGGGGVEVSTDIQAKRYEKTIWNASWSSICTLSRSTLSACVAPEVLPFTLPVVRRTMLEVLYVARAWGITEDSLPMSAVDAAIKLTTQTYGRASNGMNTPMTPAPPRGDGFGAASYFGGEESLESTIKFKPSMLLDVENGRPSELEPIVGSLLDRARAKGVATPRLDTVYATLKIHQDAVVRQYAAREEYNQHISAWLKRRPSVAGAGLEGRKAWERAMRRGEMNGLSPIQVDMARGAPKVGGKAVDIETAEADEGKRKARFE